MGVVENYGVLMLIVFGAILAATMVGFFLGRQHATRNHIDQSSFYEREFSRLRRRMMTAKDREAKLKTEIQRTRSRYRRANAKAGPRVSVQLNSAAKS
ncbi:hypothetical protein [Nereida sp. MMG025]|uniref:hypothetical protein n=1 Tax=Nereida sp. MMG025 TaxID=2909981 RepID=UPI001F18BBAF|nr:hypothetical protein [Nereida sp. MMG025]MCF6444327.1 hypothetical protein [Nereida sp. MMG025]